MDLPRLSVLYGTPEYESSADAMVSGISEEFFEEHQRISVMLRHHLSIYSGTDVSAVKLVATQFVNATLNEAINMCMIYYGMAPPAPSQLCVFDPTRHDDTHPKNDTHARTLIVDRVTVQLNRFLRQWMQRRLRFKFCVRLARRWRNTTGDADTYVFEAMFSVPTRQCPTPQCTASVFFVMDVPEIDRRSSAPLYVSYKYQFEGMHFMYTPTARGHMFDFQEHMLITILVHKMQLYQGLEF